MYAASKLRAIANCCAFGPQKKIKSGELAAPARVAAKAARTASNESPCAAAAHRPRSEDSGVAGGRGRGRKTRSAKERNAARRTVTPTRHGTPTSTCAVIAKDASAAPVAAESTIREGSGKTPKVR